MFVIFDRTLFFCIDESYEMNSSDQAREWDKHGERGGVWMIGLEVSQTHLENHIAEDFLETILKN